LQGLSNLLSSDDLFERAFELSVTNETPMQENLLTATGTGADDEDNLGGGGSSVGYSGTDKMLAMLMEDTRYFRIGERQFEFHNNDLIFTLEKPTFKREHLSEQGLCTACTVSFKSAKSVCYW
jgi:hypothetical protein